MKIGLALGSGGARGWCHIGVIQRLEERGVVPDVVAGSSMGALVGAAWACGKLDGLAHWARRLTLKRFIAYADISLSGGGLAQGKAVFDVLKRLDVPRDFTAMDRPYLAVATDMGTGREVWLREGDLHHAVRGSISMPAVFTPHRLGGKWLIDGGVTNPVPVSAARALGADVTIAVNPNAKHGRLHWEPTPRKGGLWDIMDKPALSRALPEAWKESIRANKERELPPGYQDVVIASADIMSEFVRQTRAATDPADVLLDADLSHMSVLELYRADEAIEEGRRLVDAQWDEIERVLTRAAWQPKAQQPVEELVALPEGVPEAEPVPETAAEARAALAAEAQGGGETEEMAKAAEATRRAGPLKGLMKGRTFASFFL